VTCDGRLFHRRAAATGNALSPTVDRRVRRTSRDVDEAEGSRRLVSASILLHSMIGYRHRMLLSVYPSVCYAVHCGVEGRSRGLKAVYRRVPIHFLRHFCCKMYHLARSHSEKEPPKFPRLD